MMEEGEVEESSRTETSGGIGAGERVSDAAESDEREIIRPAPPLTGTGGLSADRMPNWARVAAITAVLTFVVATLALLFGRRSDGSG